MCPRSKEQNIRLRSSKHRLGNSSCKQTSEKFSHRNLWIEVDIDYVNKGLKNLSEADSRSESRYSWLNFHKPHTFSADSLAAMNLGRKTIISCHQVTRTYSEHSSMISWTSRKSASIATSTTLSSVRSRESPVCSWTKLRTGAKCLDVTGKGSLNFTLNYPSFEHAY